MGQAPPQVRAETDLLSSHEIDRINSAYCCVGWMPSDGGEGFRYIYFDRASAFGVLHYHQDDLGALYAEQLVPLHRRSPADRALSPILTGVIRAATRTLERLEAAQKDHQEREGGGS